VYFHLLVLDGVDRRDGEGRLVFVPVPAPSADALRQLVQRIAARVGRALERAGAHHARHRECVSRLRSRRPDAPQPEVAESSGFSLHAGLAAGLAT
jgi:hypothetical protein